MTQYEYIIDENEEKVLVMDYYDLDPEGFPVITEISLEEYQAIMEVDNQNVIT